MTLQMYTVHMGGLFVTEYANFPPEDQGKINSFIERYQKSGFDELLGKNVPSCNVPHDDREFVKKVKYAQKHKLWHYHIGIPDYSLSECKTYKTSEYVLHYQKLSFNEIKIVDFGYHPPLSLPTESYFN